MPKKGNKGNLNRGPWTSADIERALARHGWYRVRGGKHICMEHSELQGKVNFSAGWTGVKPGHRVFNSIGDQSGYGKDGLIRILNGLHP